MIRRPPRSTRTDTLFPYTTLFRSPSIVNAHLHLARIYNTDFMLRLAGHDPAPLRARAFELSLRAARSEEHTSELQSLMRISYAVFCLKKKKTTSQQQTLQQSHEHHDTLHTQRPRPLQHAYIN